MAEGIDGLTARQDAKPGKHRFAAEASCSGWWR